jgi:DNA repair protein RecO (recombination protein O)
MGDATDLGPHDLAYVSPRSAAAVSRAGAIGYENRLLPLPPFLMEGGMGDWSQIIDGLRLTGFFLERSVLTDRRADMLAARERLVDRLKRAVA